MATRTISDAGGNWNATTAWVEGAVPVAGDDIVATATSGNLVVNVATASLRSFDLTNYVGTLSGSSALNISGEASATVTVNFAGTVTYTGTFTVSPVDTATIDFYSGGKTLQTINCGSTTAGVGTIEQRDNLNVSRDFFLQRGTYNTNGFSITTGRGMSAAYANTRAFNFTNSTITTGRAFNMGSDGLGADLTLTATGSTINMQGGGYHFNGAGKTYSTLNMTAAGNQGIYSSATIENLTRTGGTGASSTIIYLTANVTVTGTLTINGNSESSHVLVYSTHLFSAATITAATVVVNNADFMDITGAGASDWDLSASRSGDCGGNSNITFTPSTEQHWTNADGGNWSTAANWTSRVPLPQDDCIIDCAFNASKSVSMGSTSPVRMCRNIDWSGATINTALTWIWSTTPSFYGNIILKTGMTVSGTTGTYFRGRGNHTFTSNGVTWTHTNYWYGNYAFQDAYVSDRAVTASETVYNRTLSGNNQNITTGGVSTYSALPSDRGITLGSGTWTLFHTGNVWYMTASLLTYTKGGTIIVSNTTATAKTFYGAALDYATVTITGDNVLIRDINSFDVLNVNTAGLTNGLKLYRGQTQTVTSFNTNGAVGNLAKMESDTTSAATITYNGADKVEVDYMDIKYITGNPDNTWYVGENSNDGGNNTRLYFTISNVKKVSGIVYSSIKKILGVTKENMKKISSIE